MTWRSPEQQRPRPLAGVLSELARRVDPARVLEAQVRAALPAILGEWLHARVSDVEVRPGECVLRVADPFAARELERMAPEIVGRLRRRLGENAPARLRCVAAPAGPRRPPAEPRLRPAAERPLVAAALAEVADPATRKRLARWAGVDLED